MHVKAFMYMCVRACLCMHAFSAYLCSMYVNAANAELHLGLHRTGEMVLWLRAPVALEEDLSGNFSICVG